MIKLPRKAKGERPVYLADRTTDNLLSMMVALAGEVVVLRERLDTMERLADHSGALREEINTYRPPAGVIEERDAWRAQFLETVMQPLRQDLEELQKGEAEQHYQSAIDIVSG